MNKCTRCEWLYPADVHLSPVTGTLTTGQVCGICALEISNELHGISRKKFGGEMAEQARQDAVRARMSGHARRAS